MTQHMPIAADDLVPTADSSRFSWFHHLKGYDEETGPVTSMVEIGPKKQLVVLRLASTMLGTIGFERGQAEQAASAIRGRVRSAVTVLHPYAVVARLYLAAAVSGVVLWLDGDRVPDWRVRFGGEAADRLAVLLEEGATMLRSPVHELASRSF
ncbi:hypothetical protein C1701_11350 [Actinoalloteichus sp. AHMU CJ021]|uniref:Uncharacterized protein n=1 Tax=Actinoalloteichus caeruleus DSM 43889 TaxID=1120930 RepID=A0ABT1JKK9_ACTCY|nr:hypothetical protein [Actinoalloteichus caeruleus]AUS78856.1 hypothetical protein C1701_11350 [Actinoalloteichus sp. AHMU CJ021]MCP2333048.1 hypothetical protein [Actinoalloteichus caeruleus DSM 43889]